MRVRIDASCSLWDNFGVTDVTISLPNDLLAYARRQVDASGCRDLSELICLVLREDRAALQRLHAAIDEGEASGESSLTFDQIIEQARERAASRAA